MPCGIHISEFLSINYPHFVKIEVLRKHIEPLKSRNMFAEGAKATLSQRTYIETQLESLARLAVFHQLCLSLALEVFLYDTTRTTVKSIPNSNLLATGDYMVKGLN